MNKDRLEKIDFFGKEERKFSMRDDKISKTNKQKGEKYEKKRVPPLFF